MLYLPFLGRRPSHFKVNRIVRAFIVSETLLWSGWALVNPIFAIFVADRVAGGNISTAAAAVTVNMIARIVFELWAGIHQARSSNHAKFIYSIVGIGIVGLVYLGFAFVTHIYQVFLLLALSGMGFGISTPAKMALFSGHLDKRIESAEWGWYDAAVFGGMALTAFLGGVIAANFGFRALFMVSSVTILIGAIPFLLFFNYYHRPKHRR